MLLGARALLFALLFVGAASANRRRHAKARRFLFPSTLERDPEPPRTCSKRFRVDDCEFKEVDLKKLGLLIKKDEASLTCEDVYRCAGEDGYTPTPCRKDGTFGSYGCKNDAALLGKLVGKGKQGVVCQHQLLKSFRFVSI